MYMNIPRIDLVVSSNRLELIPVKVAGIYRFYNCNGKLLYIGKAKNLRTRIRSHLRGRSNTSDFYIEIKEIKLSYVSESLDRDILETYMINKLNPLHNKAKVFEKSKERVPDKLELINKERLTIKEACIVTGLSLGQLRHIITYCRHLLNISKGKGGIVFIPKESVQKILKIHSYIEQGEPLFSARNYVINEELGNVI